MPAYSGKDVSATWNGSDISGSSREIEIEEKAKTIDGTTRADAVLNQQFKIPGIPERMAKVKGFDADGGAPAVAGIQIGDIGTFAYNTGHGVSKSSPAVCVNKKLKADTSGEGTAEYEIEFEFRSTL